MCHLAGQEHHHTVYGQKPKNVILQRKMKKKTCIQALAYHETHSSTTNMYVQLRYLDFLLQKHL